MIVTTHAKKRIKERINIPKASVDRIANKAIDKGLKHSETSGQLCKFLDKLFLSHRTAKNIRVFNQKVFLFSQKMILITVVPLPNNLKKIADKDNERKKKSEV